MRKFFEPAEAPGWVKSILTSIRAALGDIWDTPVRPAQFETADLPTAADFAGGLVWNLTTLTVNWSNGSAWKAPQPSDPQLDAIAGLTPAADQVIYWTGPTAAAMTGLTSFGRSLIDDADASAARTTLGVRIGTDVQAQDAELAAIAGLTSAADRLPYFTGSGTASLATFTSAGRALVDDADAAAQRTTLGLGTSATVNTGTSGATIPLLNGANTFSGATNVTIGAGGGAYALTVTHNGGTASRMGLKVVTTGTSSTTDAFRVDTGTVTGAFVVTGNGGINFGGPPRLPNIAVASLPTGGGGALDGWIAFATDGRKVGEGAGAGTGVPVYFDGSTWFRFADDTAVAA